VGATKRLHRMPGFLPCECMPPASPYDLPFVAHLLASHLALTGRPLVATELPVPDAARWLYEEADFAVLAHDTSDDPCFVYANRVAQRCFERSWAELLGMPSRLSAEAPAQSERAATLARVAATGFVADYRGVRIAKSGRRFWIEQGTLWNVVDPIGVRLGQAAAFRSTRPA
jgi:hypothetical protein